MTDGNLYLGVDGGGSKTMALVIDSAGVVVGIGRSSGSNYQSLGIDVAMDHIRAAVEEALGGAHAAIGAFCLSGADTRPDFAQLEPALHGLGVCDETALYNDVIAIFRAGSTRPYGIAVVGGSGCNAGGIGRDGQEARLPSLGPLTGDRAGGHALGASAMGAAFRAWDGRGAPTRLVDTVLRTFQVPDMETLAELIVQGAVTPQRVRELAPLVFALAREGDAVACALIRAQGEEFGTAINAIARRLDLLDHPCEAVLGGSLFYGEGPLLLDTIRATVAPVAPLITITRLDTQPVVGAALLAADRAGIQLSAAALDALHAALPGQWASA
jgi:N-acetylglucosamine kinase-like BadF-type ATPase